MFWLCWGTQQTCGFLGVPWVPCVKLSKFTSHLALTTLSDGRSISINARSDENFDVVVMAASLNKPTSQIRLKANGSDLANNDGYSINYLWSKDQMQALNTLEVEATDDVGAIHKAIAIIPKP